VVSVVAALGVEVVAHRRAERRDRGRPGPRRPGFDQHAGRPCDLPAQRWPAAARRPGRAL